jgi:hypothetical protein
MADASRFPQLALPFAITGACAGWLSAAMVSNPLFGFRAKPEIATAWATVLAALTGFALTRACVGRRYDYEMGEPDPEVRPATDTWPLQITIVIAAGATTGGLLASMTPGCTTTEECIIGGALCALAFFPVCLAVIGAARRAQRARLGSIVAASDRRAVWGILAMLLAVMSLEMLPNWPAYFAQIDVPSPAPVLAILAASTLCTVGVLFADARALRRARLVVAHGLSVHEQQEAEPGAADAPRLDLGIGNEILAKVTRGAAAYRHREQTLALVKGTPKLALDALGRAVRRGMFGLALIAAAGVVHVYANSEAALMTYLTTRCGPRDRAACNMAADRVEASDPHAAHDLRQRGRQSWEELDALTP